MPQSLDLIEERAFSECESLTSLSLPSRLHRVESHVFADCTALETVLLPEHRPIMEYGVFAGCDALKTLVLPDNLRLLRYRLDRWNVPTDTSVVFHEELQLAALNDELSLPETTEERGEELRAEIKRRMGRLKLQRLCGRGRQRLLSLQEPTEDETPKEELTTENAQDESDVGHEEFTEN